jgi:hypothetical protein
MWQMAEATHDRVISEDYRRQQQELHQNPNYGVASLTYAGHVAHVVAVTEAKSVSDYGAGKQNLRKALEMRGVTLDYRPYDPAFPEYGEPQPADLVCCIDVLEHIEPEFLDNVLADLQRITVKRGFFTVHTGPAAKVLSDGRNAHLTQQPVAWWEPKLRRHFEIEHLEQAPGGFFVVVTPTVAKPL